MPPTILLVDDEQSVADFIEVYLTNENFIVHKCYTGQDALRCIEQERLDLAILDVLLPDMDGFALCRRIRELHTFPVTILTAKERRSGQAMSAEEVAAQAGTITNELLSGLGPRLERILVESQIDG